MARHRPTAAISPAPGSSNCSAFSGASSGTGITTGGSLSNQQMAANRTNCSYGTVRVARPPSTSCVRSMVVTPHVLRSVVLAAAAALSTGADASKLPTPCAAGYTGTLCALCQPRHARYRGFRCLPCGNARAMMDTLFVALGLLVGAFSRTTECSFWIHRHSEKIVLCIARKSSTRAAPRPVID